MINIFSLFTKSDKISLDVSPIAVKFNCKFCNKTNTATIAYIETKGNIVFDIANADNRTDAVWRSECAFCNAQSLWENQINRKVRDLNIKKSFAREISLATRAIKDKRKYTRKTKHKGEIER